MVQVIKQRKSILIDVDMELYNRLQEHADQLSEKAQSVGVTIQVTVDQAAVDLVERALRKIDGDGDPVPYPTCGKCGNQTGVIQTMVDLKNDGLEVVDMCLNCAAKLARVQSETRREAGDLGMDPKETEIYLEKIRKFGACGRTDCRAISKKALDPLCPRCSAVYQVFEEYQTRRNIARDRARDEAQGAKGLICDRCKASTHAKYPVYPEGKKGWKSPDMVCPECLEKAKKNSAKESDPPGPPKKPVKHRPLNIIAEPYPAKKPKTSSVPDTRGRTQWPKPALDELMNRYRQVVQCTPYEKRRTSREVAEVILDKWNYRPMALDKMAGRMSNIITKLLDRHDEVPWLGVDTESATYRVYYVEPSKQKQTSLPGQMERRPSRKRDPRIDSRKQMTKVLQVHSSNGPKFMSIREIASKAQIMFPKTQGLPVERLMKSYKEMARKWREGDGTPPAGFVHDYNDQGQYAYAITQ